MTDWRPSKRWSRCVFCAQADRAAWSTLTLFPLVYDIRTRPWSLIEPFAARLRESARRTMETVISAHVSDSPSVCRLLKRPTQPSTKRMRRMPLCAKVLSAREMRILPVPGPRTLRRTVSLPSKSRIHRLTAMRPVPGPGVPR